MYTNMHIFICMRICVWIHIYSSPSSSRKQNRMGMWGVSFVHLHAEGKEVFGELLCAPDVVFKVDGRYYWSASAIPNVSSARLSPKAQWETGVNRVKGQQYAFSLSFLFFFFAFIGTSAAVRVSFPLFEKGKDDIFLSAESNCNVAAVSDFSHPFILTGSKPSSNHGGSVSKVYLPSGCSLP